jgi:hypothetical protein
MWDQDGTSRGYRLADIMAASCLGFPMDMIHTLYDMMSGGVFDRFPTMPTMILEAGVGWLPSFFERFEEHREQFGRLKTPEWKTPPMEIFQRQMMVTIEACEQIDLKIALSSSPPTISRSRPTGPTTTGPRTWSPASRGGKGSRAALHMVATGTMERWFRRRPSVAAGNPGRRRARVRRDSAEHYHAAVDDQGLTRHQVESSDARKTAVPVRSSAVGPSGR